MQSGDRNSSRCKAVHYRISGDSQRNCIYIKKTISQKGGGIKDEEAMENILDRVRLDVSGRNHMLFGFVGNGNDPDRYRASISHGISWISEDEDWDDADEEDEEDIEDDQDEEDDQNERKQEETAASQEKETMKDATGIIEGNGKAAYQNIREIKSTVGAGRIHLKTQPDTDEITVESKDTHKKLGFRAYAKDGILYLTSNKKLQRPGM